MIALANSVLRSTTSRILAALIGGCLATIALTVAITLIWPFGDAVEQIFAGGIFFFLFWSTLFYWGLLASDGFIAWCRVGAVLLLFTTIDLYFLLFSKA